MNALEIGDWVEGFQLTAILPRVGVFIYRFRSGSAVFGVEWPSNAPRATFNDFRFTLGRNRRTLARQFAKEVA